MANDAELIGSFIWSKTPENLSKILKEYQLPQIVRVVDGFCGKNEDTSLSNEQILALHEIFSVRKLLGTDSSGKQVIIPLSCPTQVLVYPSKCKYKLCKVEDFQSIFPSKVQYVRVKSCGPQSSNASGILVKVGDILEIQEIDKKKKIVVCQNTDTKEDVTLSYKSPAIFTPLRDCRKYTLSEVVINYGLHSRVCFETTRSQTDQNSDQWNSALTGLTEVAFHKVLTEVRVIATTVGGVGEIKHCIGLPTDLPIHCEIAERFTDNSRSYEDVVRSLHAGFNRKNLSERINLFQDKNAIKKYDLTSSKSMPTVQRPQPDILLKPVHLNATRSPPKVSPKPKKRVIKSPNNSMYPPDDAKQPSQSLPEECTMTTEAHDEPTRNHPEVSTTTDEDDYVDMRILGKNVCEYVNQSNLPMNVWINNSHLVGNANCPSTPKVQHHLRKDCPQQQAPSNRPELNSKYSQGYEEVKPVWNYSKQEFADPNLIPKDNNDLNKKQLSEVHSDYVIMIPPNVTPQTRKFVINKRTDAKNNCLNTSYENVECVRDIPNGRQKHAYENVVTDVGMGLKFQGI